jgi:hypothetical protein
MNADQFIQRLIVSYVPGLRPDDEFIANAVHDVRMRGETSAVLEAAYDIIKDTYRMFPGLADISYSLAEARAKIYKGQEPDVAFEYFRIDGIGYRRKVEIDPSGNLARRELPEGAYDYTLWLPYKYRAREEALSADEAFAEGCLDEQLYRVMKAKNPNPKSSRWEKIGNIIKEEEKPASVSDYDDSMFPPEEAQFDISDMEI